MKYIVRLVLVCTLLFGGTLPAFAQEDTPLVQPASGTPGTRFVFVVSGFTQNERLSFWLNAPTGAVVPATVDAVGSVSAAGQVSWNWIAPSDATLGTWQMVAYGNTSGVTRVVPFTIVSTYDNTGNAANTAEANIFPNSGTPGTTFTFYASGFYPNETVTIEAVGPNGITTNHNFDINYNTGGSGRVDGRWSTFSDTPAGAWSIYIRGLTSGIVRTLNLSIDAPPPPATNIVVSPEVGKQSQRFLFSATGFLPDEEVSVWLNAPNGQAVVANVNDLGKVQGNSRVSWSWVAPDDAQVGTWQMVAQGRTSNLQQIVSFQIIAK